MSENIENTEVALEPKKRTVKEFLSQYRNLGLPGAKRFRRRTRLAQASWQHEVDIQLAQHLVAEVKRYMKVLAELSKEENWAVKGEDVVWIGESDPLEIIRKAQRGE